MILWMKSPCVTIQMKANSSAQFSVVLFIMLYKVVLTFDSVKEILKCNHSNESLAVHFCGTVYYDIKLRRFSFVICG